MKRLIKYKHLLSNFQNFTKREKELLRKHMPLDFVKLLIEIAGNYLKGHIPLDKKNEKILKPYKKKLQSLTNCQTSLCKRKKILQRGGFAGLVLGAVASALISHFLSNALDNNDEN